MQRKRISLMDVFTFVEVMITAGILIFNISAAGYILRTFVSKNNILILVIVSGFTVFSLIVAGMGIMGIQLVAVSRRKKEIGLHMAIGATSKDIICMIIVGSITKTLLPALPGFLIGCFLSPVFSRVLEIPINITGGSILLSFIIIFMFSIGTGIYPALKACSIEPIEVMSRTPGLR